MHEDLIGAGFEAWWAEEGHERYRVYQTLLGFELPLKQLARDAWYNGRRDLFETIGAALSDEQPDPIFTADAELTEFPDIDTMAGDLDDGGDVWSRNGNI